MHKIKAMGKKIIGKSGKLKKKFYERELKQLFVELVKLQNWVKNERLKVVILFEGRDAAGKGAAIKKITVPLNPRISRVVALGVPTEREKTQWYFQRYVAHLPAAGEMVFFDRSWYNRAGVEKVMGYCNEEEYWEFLRSCPSFERMLMRSGITLIKYWFSVSEEEQEKRFLNRIHNPTKRWKFSPMDLVSRERWVDYSKAKDEMFSYTDTKQAPWHVVESDDKRRAQLNCIRHLLSLFEYREEDFPVIELGPRPRKAGYVRPPIEEQTFIPDRYQETDAKAYKETEGCPGKEKKEKRKNKEKGKGWDETAGADGGLQDGEEGQQAGEEAPEAAGREEPGRPADAAAEEPGERPAGEAGDPLPEGQKENNT